MPQDPGLAFAQNLVDRYMQFKALQFQTELTARRERRYERQLQNSLAYQGVRLGQMERGLGLQETDPRRELGQEKLAFLRAETTTPEQRAAVLGGGAVINISAGERERTAESLASMDALYNLRALYDSAKTRTGPLTGRVDPLIGQLGLTSREQEDFMAASSAFQNKIIKEITGAQMSEAEADRILQQVPRIIDHPTRWEAKWGQSLQNLRYLQGRRKQIQAGQTPAPWVPPSEGPSEGTMFPSERPETVQPEGGPVTYPYGKPQDRQAFLDMVRRLKEEGGIDAARRYYEQWKNSFDWEED